MNIPNYRAKKIDREEYVVGSLFPINGKYIIIEDKSCREIYTYYGMGNFGEISQSGKLGTFEIDPSTLAINFPDMIDSNNKPIFASLSECGRGGDELKYVGNDSGKEMVCKFDKEVFEWNYKYWEITKTKS